MPLREPLTRLANEKLDLRLFLPAGILAFEEMTEEPLLEGYAIVCLLYTSPSPRDRS